MFDTGTLICSTLVGIFTAVVFVVQMNSVRRKRENPRESNHPRVDDGRLRAAVFGFSDGVVSNVCLILGVYISIGQDATEETVNALARSRSVVISGLAGLLAGACSMACGEWLSMTAQKEGLQAQLQTMMKNLEDYKTQEQDILKEILIKRGMSSETARLVIKDLEKKGPKAMLPFHAQMVLGIDCNEMGSPLKTALSSFGCFAVGAVTPLIPWIFMDNHIEAIWWTVIMVCSGVSVASGILSRFSPWGVVWNTIRQLGVLCISVVVSMASSYFLVGSVVD